MIGNKFSVIVFIFGLIAASVQKPNNNNNRVECGIAKQDAESGQLYQGQWPFTAAIYHLLNDQVSFLCGGTIVSRIFIISAAHCFVDKSEVIPKFENDLLVRVGVYNMDNFRESGSYLYHVAKLIIHEEWNTEGPCYDADIALVRVRKQIQFDDLVRPICLFNHNDLTGDISEGWLVGFGESSSAFLRKQKLPILPTSMCMRVEGGYADKISPRMFCAGTKHASNICPNDMGDGLFVKSKGKYYLAGIASFAYNMRHKECDFKNTALFTNAHVMSPWIDQHVRPNQVQAIKQTITSTKRLMPTRMTTTRATTTRATTTAKRPVPLDMLFFPNDDGYDWDKQTRWQMTSTTSRYSAAPIKTSTSATVDYIDESDEPTFDINAKHMSSPATATTKFYPKFTEKPIPKPMINEAITKFQFDCGRMEQFKSTNGGKSAWNEFPWTASIVRRGNTQHIAVGTLLSFHHVFVNLDELKSINVDKPQHLPEVNELQVYLGLNDLKKISSATVVGVQKIHRNSQSANFGIIILSKPVDYGKKIFPICLLESTNNPITTAANLYSVGFEGQERKSIVYNVKQSQACDKATQKDAICVQRSVACLAHRSQLYGKVNDLWYLIADQNAVKTCAGPIRPENNILLNKFTPWLMTTILST